MEELGAVGARRAAAGAVSSGGVDTDAAPLHAANAQPNPTADRDNGGSSGVRDWAQLPDSVLEVKRMDFAGLDDGRERGGVRSRAEGAVLLRTAPSIQRRRSPPCPLPSP